MSCRRSQNVWATRAEENQTPDTSILERISVQPRCGKTGAYLWIVLDHATADLTRLIVDGMNAGNLRGLDAFEARTATPRVDYSYRMYQGVQDSCDDITSVPYRYPAYAGGRRFGPTPNSTTCGRCTLDWFGRKLLSFEKNAISDPKTGKVVNLKEYLLRIKQAGERCDGAAWDRSWSRALRKYKASGDLPADWNGERKGKGDDGPMKPCPPSEEARRVE